MSCVWPHCRCNVLSCRKIVSAKFINNFNKNISFSCYLTKLLVAHCSFANVVIYTFNLYPNKIISHGNETREIKKEVLFRYFYQIGEF